MDKLHILNFFHRIFYFICYIENVNIILDNYFWVLFQSKLEPLPAYSIVHVRRNMDFNNL